MFVCVVSVSLQEAETAGSPLATPTEVRSPSPEDTPTNQNQTLILSPTPSITPTATPTSCDIISCDLISRPADPGEPDADSGCSSAAPPAGRANHALCLLLGDGDSEVISVLQCQQVADELKQTVRHAVHLYTQVSLMMSSVT